MVTYVTDGDWGTGVHAPLSAAQIDGNFYEVKQAIQDLIDNPVPGRELSNIAVVSRTVTFYYSDDTEQSFTMPYATFRYRGVFADGAVYSEMDIVSVTGEGLFLVLQAHTAVTPFDDGLTTEDGAVYQFILPSTTLKSTEIVDAVFTPTADYNGTFNLCTYAGGCEVTLPDDLDVDTEITFKQMGIGPVSFVATDDINGLLGFDNVSGGLGSVVTVKYCIDGFWHLWGRLAPVSA